MVTTHAGKGGHGPEGGGFSDGLKDSAEFDVPTACYVMSDGKVFVGDGSNHRVRVIEADSVSSFAGTGVEGFEDGPDTLATFNFPRATVFDYSRNRLYVVDYGNHAVRIIHVEEDITNVPDYPESTTLLLYPNPVQSVINFDYELGSDSHVSISIYDRLGREVARVIEEGQTRGKQAIQWDASCLNAGIYFCALRTDNNNISVVQMIKID
jgi:DNA-binding beta-propeller fold protein YncE